MREYLKVLEYSMVCLTEMLTKKVLMLEYSREYLMVYSIEVLMRSHYVRDISMQNNLLLPLLQ